MDVSLTLSCGKKELIFKKERFLRLQFKHLEFMTKLTTITVFQRVNVSCNYKMH